MKKLFIVVVLICMALFCKAQITDKPTIKSWVQTGDKPTQEQFWHWMDSYWHKSELIPSTSITGFVPGTDSVFSRNDSIFGVKNGIEYFVATLTQPISTLYFGAGFVPGFFNGLLDITANIDTAEQVATKYDLSQIFTNPNDTFNFSVIRFVDTPLTGVTSGASYLIVHSPSQFLGDGITANPFYIHFDQIAKYNGTSYDFFIPNNNDVVIVTSTEALYTYKGIYSTGSWNLSQRAHTVGGEKLGINPKFGTIDNKDIILITHNIEMGRLLHDGNVKFNSLAHAGSDLDSDWIIQPRTDGTLYTKKESIVYYKLPLHVDVSNDSTIVSINTTGLGGTGGGNPDSLHNQLWSYYLNRANHTGTQAWSTIIGTPTTLSGYGITDAVPSSRTITINGVAHDLSIDRSWTVSGVSAGDTSTLNVHTNGYNDLRYYPLSSNPAGYLSSIDTGNIANFWSKVRSLFGVVKAPLSYSNGYYDFDSAHWHSKPYYDGVYQPLGSYLTSYTETDPIVKAINGIVKSNGTTISAAVSTTDYAVNFVRTSVKTSAYTAAVNDLVPVNTTSGSVTITLPTAPIDKARIAIKHILQGSTNTVTIAAGGSDVFNKTSGSTTLTLFLLNQGIELEYDATNAVWTVLSDDLPLTQLDARYAAAGSTGGITSLNTLTGSTQTFATGTSGTDFGISSSGTTHTFNIPDASASARGLVTTGAQTFAGVKTFTSPLINVGSDATGDMYYRNGSGLFTRLPIGSAGSVLTPVGGLPAWSTIGITDTLAHTIYGNNGANVITKLAVSDTTSATSTRNGWSPALEFDGTAYGNSISNTSKVRQYYVPAADCCGGFSGTFYFDAWNKTFSTSAAWNNIMNFTTAVNNSYLTFNGNMILNGVLFGPTNSFVLYPSTSENKFQTQSSGGYWTYLSTNAVVNSSGTHSYFSIKNAVTSTGSAANSDLTINRTETSTGSGNQFLIDAQVNSTSKFSVTNKGVLNLQRPIATSGSTPSVSAGTGAGTSPTVSATGNDISGYVTIATGSSPTASGDIVTITFSTALTNTPTSIQLTPAEANAATESTKFYVDQSTASTTSFKIKNTSSALTASTTYKFYYTVTQ